MNKSSTGTYYFATCDVATVSNLTVSSLPLNQLTPFVASWYKKTPTEKQETYVEETICESQTPTE